jgi:hypothetical protein
MRYRKLNVSTLMSMAALLVVGLSLSSFDQPAQAVDCTQTTAGAWNDLTVTFSCPAACSGTDTKNRDDNCCDNIKVTCGPDPSFCKYRYWHNTHVRGVCIFAWGQNEWQYKLTPNGDRYHSMRHTTLHPHTSCACGEGCPGWYCWKVVKHNCITGSDYSSPYNRRSTTWPASKWEGDGSADPTSH